MARRISARANYVKGTLNFADLDGDEITIHHVTLLEGDFGEYVVCEVSYLDDDHQFLVQTGATQVVANLKACIADGDLPIDCLVRVHGKSVRLE